MKNLRRTFLGFFFPVTFHDFRPIEEYRRLIHRKYDNERMIRKLMAAVVAKRWKMWQKRGWVWFFCGVEWGNEPACFVSVKTTAFISAALAIPFVAQGQPLPAIHHEDKMQLKGI